MRIECAAHAVVEAARQAALAHGAGLIIGFGGGSSLDVAKLVACLARPGAPALITRPAPRASAGSSGRVRR